MEPTATAWGLRWRSELLICMAGAFMLPVRPERGVPLSFRFSVTAELPQLFFSLPRPDFAYVYHIYHIMDLLAKLIFERYA